MLPAFGRIGCRKAGLETGAPSVRFRVPMRGNLLAIKPLNKRAFPTPVHAQALQIVREIVTTCNRVKETPNLVGPLVTGLVIRIRHCGAKLSLEAWETQRIRDRITRPL